MRSFRSGTAVIISVLFIPHANAKSACEGALASIAGEMTQIEFPEEQNFYATTSMKIFSQIDRFQSHEHSRFVGNKSGSELFNAGLLPEIVDGELRLRRRRNNDKMWLPRFMLDTLWDQSNALDVPKVNLAVVGGAIQESALQYVSKYYGRVLEELTTSANNDLYDIYRQRYYPWLLDLIVKASQPGPFESLKGDVTSLPS